MLNELRSSVETINKRLWVLSVVVMILTAIISVLCQMNQFVIYAAGMISLHLIACSILMFAVYKIWHTIQCISHSYHNERLILFLGISFFTYTLFMLSGYGMLIYISSSSGVDTRRSYLNLLKFSYLYFLVSIICNLLTNYSVVFMLYIILRITSKDLNADIKDPVLGRKIP